MAAPPPAWDSLTIFTCLWAQVMLLQVVKLFFTASSATADRTQVLSFLALISFACLCGMVAPERGEATLLLNGAALVVLCCTGSQSNHVFLEIVVCFAVLMTYSADRVRWRAQLVHAIRLFLAALYAVTAIHKLNYDWTSNKWSCCNQMIGGLIALKPLEFLRDPTPIGLGAYFVYMYELAMPGMLLWRSDISLRNAAILGCLFHLPICMMLPPMSVYPFTVLMVPLFVFVVPGHVEAFVARLARGVDGPLRAGAAALLPVVAAAMSKRWTKLMAPDLPDGVEPFEYPPYGCWAAGVIWCLVVYTALISAAALRLGTMVEVRPTWRARWLAVGVFLFGFCPYLGIRNYPALAMFSNLRTEGGRSNHHYIGDDFDLIGWQRDYVTVHETDIRALHFAQVDLGPLYTHQTKWMLMHIWSEREFWLTPPVEAWPHEYTRKKGWRQYSMPFLELRRRVAPLVTANATGTVKYTRTKAKAELAYPSLWRWLGKENLENDTVVANITYDLAVGGDPELEEPLPWWVAAIARWRTFDVSYSPCRH